MGHRFRRVAGRNLDMVRGFLRRVIFLRLLLILAALSALAAPPAAAQGYSRAAQQVIDRAYAASGGSGWLMLRGWRETGREGAVAYERWIDPVRYGLREERRGAAGLELRGFNGQADWRVAADGTMTAVNDHATLAQDRSEAFFGANAFFFAGRFGARGDHLGRRSHGGRSFDVVRVTPWNGAPRELWFDRGSGLLGRILTPGRRPQAVAVSDYRKVGPVRVAFRYTPESGGPPRQIETLAFAPADRGVFSLDRPAALARVRAAAP
jgi:hypothetical protein